jgi:serine/threonine protein kinase
VEIRESKIFEDENYLSSDESGKVRAKQQRLLKKESSSL